MYTRPNQFTHEFPEFHAGVEFLFSRNRRRPRDRSVSNNLPASRPEICPSRTITVGTIKANNSPNQGVVQFRDQRMKGEVSTFQIFECVDFPLSRIGRVAAQHTRASLTIMVTDHWPSLNIPSPDDDSI